MNLPRMRTPRQALAAIKEADPGSAISLGWLYSQIRRGTIPHVSAGNRSLINLDQLIELLSNPQRDVVTEECNDIYDRVKVRRID